MNLESKRVNAEENGYGGENLGFEECESQREG